MTDEITIDLDRKTRAHRDDNRWAVQKLKPDGSWDLVDSWEGGRRSLYQWMAEHDVHPSREAEQKLAVIPEQKGWKDR